DVAAELKFIPGGRLHIGIDQSDLKEATFDLVQLTQLHPQLDGNLAPFQCTVGLVHQPISLEAANGNEMPPILKREQADFLVVNDAVIEPEPLEISHSPCSPCAG